MEPAVPDGPAGKRDINPVAEDILFFPRGRPFRESPVDLCGKALLDLVAVLAKPGSLLGRHLRDVAQQTRQQALSTEKLGPNGLNLLFRAGFPECSLGLLPKDLKLSGHACRSPFAMFAISEKARGSWTARSARILRSISTPALPIPQINRL